MSCETFEPLLADYATGTLPDLPRARLLEHIRECPACAAVVRDYDSLHQRLARLRNSLDLIEPPYVLTPMEQASEKRHLTMPRPFVRAAGWAFAAVIGMAILLWPTKTGNERTPAVVELSITATRPSSPSHVHRTPRFWYQKSPRTGSVFSFAARTPRLVTQTGLAGRVKTTRRFATPSLILKKRRSIRHDQPQSHHLPECLAPDCRDREKPGRHT
ncbi:MAG: zf-HC2 domain-containing protein [Planctomycetes bacterium]|nr:zf-HC2 domain-containing protein [Planctomycetota bacterium]